MRGSGMGIWRSIFGWRSLFRWDALGVVVPGIFMAVGFGVLGVDWLPHHLLIAQVCLGIAASMCIVKFIGHAVESNGAIKSRISFAVLLPSLTLAGGVWMIKAIQKHKTEAATTEKSSPAPLPGVIITQTATGSDCSNIVAKDARVRCEAEKVKKEHDKEKLPPSNP
jgi:hypothetical protein